MILYKPAVKNIQIVWFATGLNFHCFYDMDCPKMVNNLAESQSSATSIIQ